MSIVLPVGISFNAWASSLFIDYSTQEVPVPPEEAEWKIWAQRLVARNVFQNDQIPSPYGFSDWRSWAMRVVQVLGA